jgi:hypothetical protein
MRLKKSTLDCRAERTLDATTVVDFVPRGVDLRSKKNERHFLESQTEKSEKTSSFAARAGLRLRPKSACATGEGLGAIVNVNLCHRSGLKYLSHGFQTQDMIAARAGLRVRPESACVPGPWISDQRYGARVFRVLGLMVQSMKTTCS